MADDFLALANQVEENASTGKAKASADNTRAYGEYFSTAANVGLTITTSQLDEANTALTATAAVDAKLAAIDAAEVAHKASDNLVDLNELVAMLMGGFTTSAETTAAALVDAEAEVEATLEAYTAAQADYDAIAEPTADDLAVVEDAMFAWEDAVEAHRLATLYDTVAALLLSEYTAVESIVYALEPAAASDAYMADLTSQRVICAAGAKIAIFKAVEAAATDDYYVSLAASEEANIAATDCTAAVAAATELLADAEQELADAEAAVIAAEAAIAAEADAEATAAVVKRELTSAEQLAMAEESVITAQAHVDAADAAVIEVEANAEIALESADVATVAALALEWTVQGTTTTTTTATTATTEAATTTTAAATTTTTTTKAESPTGTPGAALSTNVNGLSMVLPVVLSALFF
jgi:hypothetical protein